MARRRLIALIAVVCLAAIGGFLLFMTYGYGPPPDPDALDKYGKYVECKQRCKAAHGDRCDEACL